MALAAEIWSRGLSWAERLLITCDAGSSNSSRSLLCKLGLQALTDELGMRISDCHFPRSTSKCNKVEYRMFSDMVNRIGAVTTKEGLTIRSALDKNRSETGRKVTEDEIESPSIERDKFHGGWDYTLTPRALNDGVV